jgi:hypothetical protein
MFSRRELCSSPRFRRVLSLYRRGYVTELGQFQNEAFTKKIGVWHRILTNMGAKMQLWLNNNYAGRKYKKWGLQQYKIHPGSSSSGGTRLEQRGRYCSILRVSPTKTWQFMTQRSVQMYSYPKSDYITRFYVKFCIKWHIKHGDLIYIDRVLIPNMYENWPKLVEI